MHYFQKKPPDPQLDFFPQPPKPRRPHYATVGSWLFRSSSFRKSFFSQVAMNSWFMVCLSTSSVSCWPSVRSGKLFTAYTGWLKTIVSLDTTCTFVGVCWEPDKKKVASVCGFISVRWRQVRSPTHKRGENLFNVTHFAQGFFVWMSLQSHGGRMTVDLGNSARNFFDFGRFRVTFGFTLAVPKCNLQYTSNEEPNQQR